MHVVCKGISALDQRLLFPWCNCGNLKVVGKRERLCQKTDVMILLHFRLYKGKKTPLLRKHSICSEPQRCCFIFFLLISYYYMQYHSTTGRYFSSVHFLWWNTALPFSSVFSGSGFCQGQAFHVQLKASQRGSLFPQGGFSVLLKSRCADAASVAKMDGAVLGRSKAQITARSARPPQWPHCHFKLFFLTQALLILPAAAILWFAKCPELGMFNIIIIFLTV